MCLVPREIEVRGCLYLSVRSGIETGKRKHSRGFFPPSPTFLGGFTTYFYDLRSVRGEYFSLPLGSFLILFDPPRITNHNRVSEKSKSLPPLSSRLKQDR